MQADQSGNKPISREIIDHTYDMTVVDIDVNGNTGSTLVNHLSDVTLQITDGYGEVRTNNARVLLQEGDSIEIKHGTPYRYAGEMALVAYFRPMLIAETISVDGSELSKDGRRILRNYNAAIERAEIDGKLGDIASKMVALIATADSCKDIKA